MRVMIWPMNKKSNSRDLYFILPLLVGVFFCIPEPTVHGQDPETQDKSSDVKGDTPSQLPGFRFNSRKKKSVSAEMSGVKKSDPQSKKNESTSDSGVAVGVVKEQAALPPELKDIAQQGAMAVAMKKWKTARKIYLDLLEKAPDNALAYANLGVVEHQLKNLSAADANLTRSLQINPTIAQNWLSLGVVQYEKGDLNLAISSLTRAIHEAPNDGQTRLVLAAVIRDYGWEEAAIMELKRALMIDPKLADAHYNLALSYLSFDPPKLELARRHYYSAIDLGTAPSAEIEKQFELSPVKK